MRTAPGTPIRSATCDGSTRQRWIVQGGTVVNPSTGRCLDVEGAASANGTRLILHTFHGGANQQWTAPVRP